ncbi:hypothetical protein Pla22_43250 [Rubripirellula amarantea]|uniref:Uncharacterized protein n=1 Tax=Rubripirellula amarantea TaxID=2527999 RepID=A0A5C5WGJ0_9BACT|nr:hypothetical protein Pla22_43250 [Rubripirellula amarantea]
MMSVSSTTESFQARPSTSAYTNLRGTSKDQFQNAENIASLQRKQPRSFTRLMPAKERVC